MRDFCINHMLNICNKQVEVILVIVDYVVFCSMNMEGKNKSRRQPLSMLIEKTKEYHNKRKFT